MSQIKGDIITQLKKICTPDQKTGGDPRLRRIWQILNLFGILSIKESWKMGIRNSIIIVLLLPSYLNDMVHFIEKIIEWEFHSSRDVEMLTFAQTHSITAYRIYLLIHHRQELRKLVSYITDVFPSWIEEGDDDKKRILEKSAKNGMWIYYCHSIQLVSVSSLLVLRPMLSSEPFALVMNPPIGTIPWIPVDRSGFYEMTYIYQVCSTSMEISVAFCMNMLFFTLLIRACAHIDCMAVDLDGLGKLGSTKPDNQIIMEFVEKYNTVERFTALFNKLFFNLTAIQPLYTGFSFVGIAVAHMLELFIYCYVGELTAGKSSELGAHLFGTPWYNLSLRDKKSVLQILHRCQKPFSIRAGLFGNFSREMFTTTMKTTYSTWAVLNQAK